MRQNLRHSHCISGVPVQEQIIQSLQQFCVMALQRAVLQQFHQPLVHFLLKFHKTILLRMGRLHLGLQQPVTIYGPIKIVLYFKLILLCDRTCYIGVFPRSLLRCFLCAGCSRQHCGCHHYSCQIPPFFSHLLILLSL